MTSSSWQPPGPGKPTKQFVMSGVQAGVTSAKLVGHALVRYETDKGEIVFRLWETDIVRVTDKEIILSSGGWRTMTTKMKINKVLDELGFGYGSEVRDLRVGSYKGSWSIGGAWFADKESASDKFFDGIRFSRRTGKTLNGTVGKLAVKREERLKKQITDYGKMLKHRLMTQGGLHPAAGDCLYCNCSLDKMTKAGKVFPDNDHIMLHIKDKYIHGSLNVLALLWAGWRKEQLFWQVGQPGTPMDERSADRLTKTVQKFLKAQAGMA